MTKKEPRKQSREQQNKPIFRGLIMIGIIVVLSLTLFRVVLANVLATSGQRLAAANQQIKILNEENQQLENSISSLRSLSRIEKLAKKIGLVKTTKVQLLTQSQPIANR